VRFCFAALPSCDYVMISPLCHSVVLSPLYNSVVISPSCNSVVISPSCDSVVISPSRDSVVILPLCDSVRIGYLNTLAVFCTRRFPYGAWFLVRCIHLSFAIRPKNMTIIFNHLVSKTGFTWCSNVVSV
jgi:hypothetical protein